MKLILKKVKKDYEFISITGYYGLRPVLNDGKWGVINSRGKEIINTKYDSVYILENRYVIVRSDACVGVINDHGKLIIPLNYSAIKFSCGYFILTKPGQEGNAVADIDGKIIFPYQKGINCKIDEKTRFIIAKLNQKYGLYDSNGNTLLPIIYEKIYNIKYHYAEVYFKGRSGFVKF